MQNTFFFHIPKCAGMSVWNALWDIHGFSNVFQVGIKSQREEFEAMDRERREAFGAVGGHGPMRMFRQTMGADLDSRYKIVTFRNPVDRAVSAWNFIRRLPTHHNYERVANESLMDFAMKEMPNMQTTLLCGRAHWEVALESLEEFDDWCLLEDLDAMIARLYRHQGLEPKSAVHANESVREIKKSEIDDETLEVIRSRNRGDMKFYGELKKLTAERQTADLASQDS